MTSGKKPSSEVELREHRVDGEGGREVLGHVFPEEEEIIAVEQPRRRVVDPEIVTITIALGAVGSTLDVLARFNGPALPEWPYYITLNALTVLLATVTTATMGISLDKGLSRLKGIHFKESRAPLTDMEAFDDASRGTWGAARLLASARGGQASCRPGFVPMLPLKSAVYNGFFAENGRAGAALAFDLTEYMRQYCEPGAAADDCGWQVPQGAGLASGLEVFNMTSYIPAAMGDMPHAKILKLIFMGTEAQDGNAGELKS
ncbi:hypothetical protein DL769_005180 [Monosporascus sp. CRB-8-3]|nr:hypothetical protein DL769_005180 [Monosporascus sp. CRB-8-3]